MANVKKASTVLADMEALRKLNYRPDEKSPECGRDCFACTDGKCCILADTQFGETGCPFYKTWEKAKAEQRASLEHLVVLGKYKLIEKYESVLAALGIFALLDDGRLDVEATLNGDQAEVVDREYVSEIYDSEIEVKYTFSRVTAEISSVDGIPCRSLIFLGDPDKHGSREMLLYWDRELPVPDLEPGTVYTVKYTGRNIIGIQSPPSWQEVPSYRP